MRVERKSLIYIGLLLYFCLPKFDLISIPGVVTGVRVQDFLSLFLLFLMSSFIIKFLIRFDFIVLFYIFMSVFVLFHFFLGNYGGVFLLIRYLEYSVVGLSVCFLSLRDGMRPFLLIIFFHFVVAILQKYSFLPSVDTGRGLIFSKERSAGLTGNALELGYFSVTVFSFYVYYYRFLEERKSVKLLVIFSFISFMLIYLSGSRFPFLIFFLVLLLFLFGLKTYFFLALMSIPLVYISINFYLSTDYHDVFLSYCGSFDVGSLEGVKKGELLGVFDKSFEQRLLKVCSVSSYFNNNQWNYLYGLGPMSLGGALDSGLLRIFFEFGFISFFIFPFLLRLSFFGFLFFVSINLMYDGFLNSMVMPFVFSIFYLRAFHSLRQRFFWSSYE